MEKVKQIECNPLNIISAPEISDLQRVMPISEQDRARLTNDIEEAGEVRDPLKGYIGEDGKVYIFAGMNRMVIARKLKLKKVPVDIYSGTREEIRELSVKDNLNRRHLSREQKIKLIDYFLKADPERSNRAIGRVAGADHKTVSRRRKELENIGRIPETETVKDPRGRKHPVKKGPGEIPQVGKGKDDIQDVKENGQGTVDYEREFRMLCRELKEQRDMIIDIHGERETFSRRTLGYFVEVLDRLLQKYGGE